MRSRVRKTSKVGLTTGLILGAASILAAGTAPAQALDVTVSGLRNGNGNVVICIWRVQDKGFPHCGTGRPFKKLTVPATAPHVAVKDLPPGDYAISLFHDEKKRGKVETNFLGMPTSGIGLANNPRFGPTSPPTFEKTRVVVPARGALDITVKYLF